MARIIPTFHEENTAPGEREVFNYLAKAPDDWVTIHSLDLAPWNRGRRTEIDFVVIMPDTGIVCIEVKSHHEIAFVNDRWCPDSIKRSPFKQAVDASSSFYRRMIDIMPRFRHIPVTHCCVFSCARFDLHQNMAVAEWELIDGNRFLGYPDAISFCEDLKSRTVRGIEANPAITPLSTSMAPGWIDSILEMCLPVRRRRPDKREEIHRREVEMENILREQQKPVLQLAEMNERLLVGGAAGTGKTLIAMEIARRAAERGQRVALLCFNRLVGDWMKTKMDELDPPLPNLLVGRVFQVLVQLAGIVVPPNPSADYWEQELPDLLEDRLTDPDFEAVTQFDMLVLDEAQDVLARPALWQILSQFLEGGVAGGAYVLLGDFDHQILADSAAVEDSLKEIELTARPVRWKLDENCRNYRVVGDTAVTLSGFGKFVYSGYRRGGGGHKSYDIVFYASMSRQAEGVKREIQNFRDLGYKEEEVTILTCVAEDRSVVSNLRKLGVRLCPVGENGRGVHFTTIHAFKGLESKVVILTDLVPADQGFQRHLLYTGMTRATEAVRIFCDAKHQDVLLGWMMENN